MTINDELRTSIEAAVEEAKQRRHEYLTIEHLLFALCADASAVKILKGVGVKPGLLVDQLGTFFESHLEPLPEALEDTDPNQAARINVGINRSRCDEVVNCDCFTLLPPTVNAANTLVNTHRVPRKVIIDDTVTKLVVQAFASNL